jgi:hypothetical protein
MLLRLPNKKLLIEDGDIDRINMVKERGAINSIKNSKQRLLEHAGIFAHHELYIVIAG